MLKNLQRKAVLVPIPILTHLQMGPNAANLGLQRHLLLLVVTSCHCFYPMVSIAVFIITKSVALMDHPALKENQFKVEFIILTLNVFFQYKFVTLATECPSSHPYPYLKGTTCCQHQKTCNGNPLSFDSDCCQNGDYSFCTKSICFSKGNLELN